jgi:hypothetical protein
VFKDNYTLIDGIIISSKNFENTSRSSEFPILIGLYKKSNGMNYDYIYNFKFKTENGKTFALSDFDYIGNYIQKYPRKSDTGDILFYTLRDINALKRNKTFIEKPTANAIRVKAERLDYYVYVDTFKSFISHVPYYFGNLDIIIDDKLFQSYKKYFKSYSARKNCWMKYQKLDNDKDKIIEYLKQVLGEHYVD